MMMDFRRVLDALAAHLEKRGHRWLMVGGLAMQVHGLARATRDLDLVTDASAQEGLVLFMEFLGYETLHRSPAFSNHLHKDGSFGRVDLIYVDQNTAERLVAGSRTVSWLGRNVVVPSARHLIAMKVHAVRNDPSRQFREMADIQHLLAAPEVDRGEVRRYFEEAGLGKLFDELLRLL